MKIPLSILCQSPVSEGMTNTEAINNTIDLAKFADENDFKRFWVSEHHNSVAFASASPEIMMARIASLTQKIRVGSGGVLIPNFSALKIAEIFNNLQAHFPDRIDLGFGRSSGADLKTSIALGSDRLDNSFNKISETIDYISNVKTNSSIKAYPLVDCEPDYWVLGTSQDSAKFAAEKGLKYCFGSFISSEKMMESLQTYFQYFTPSKYLSKPYLCVGIFALVSETESEAIELAKPVDNWFVRSFLRKEDCRFPSPNSLSNFTYSQQEEMILKYRKTTTFVGQADRIASEIVAFKSKFAIDEISLISITFNHQDRIKSYKLLKEHLS
jgi:luciferase family oxidoreductase group 1